MEEPFEDRMDSLSKRLSAFRRNIFLVCDGAIMPDLKNAFLRIGLEATPLFFGKLDPSITDAGPWMITIDERETKLTAALTLAKRNKVGVCWIADCSSEEMVHHLRGLNIARLPDGSICYFRHYDVDVLAWLSERLDGEQASRLMGPACGIGFASGFAVGAIIDRPDSLPPPNPGPIAFSESQLRLFEERDNAKSRVAIKDFLRFSFPSESSRLSDEQIVSFIAAREQKARSFGLVTERQIALYSHASVKAPRTDLMDKVLAERVKALDD